MDIHVDRWAALPGCFLELLLSVEAVYLQGRPLDDFEDFYGITGNIYVDMATIVSASVEIS
jgi:hypothetical protein